MTPLSDELLMAYADGELDAAQRAEIQAAIDADAALAQRVHAMVDLRARVQSALGAELEEPVPERLLQALRMPATHASLADLRRAEAANDSWGWQQWGGMAASMLIGVALARLWPATAPGPFASEHGRIVAQGSVEKALTSQLAADAVAPGQPAVQLSFVDRAGRLCRTFTLERNAGLACRDGNAWAVQALATSAETTDSAMRPASTALPKAVLDAVDESMVGSALDAEAERAARDRGWRL
jgi:anti-sigma factor RsiW